MGPWGPGLGSTRLEQDQPSDLLGQLLRPSGPPRGFQSRFLSPVLGSVGTGPETTCLLHSPEVCLRQGAALEPLMPKKEALGSWVPRALIWAKGHLQSAVMTETTATRTHRQIHT